MTKHPMTKQGPLLNESMIETICKPFGSFGPWSFEFVWSLVLGHWSLALSVPVQRPLDHFGDRRRRRRRGVRTVEILPPGVQIVAEIVAAGNRGERLHGGGLQRGVAVVKRGAQRLRQPLVLVRGQAGHAELAQRVGGRNPHV